MNLLDGLNVSSVNYIIVSAGSSERKIKTLKPLDSVVDKMSNVVNEINNECVPLKTTHLHVF